MPLVRSASSAVVSAWAMEAPQGRFIRLVRGCKHVFFEHTGTGELHRLPSGQWSLVFSEHGSAYLGPPECEDEEDPDLVPAPFWANDVLRYTMHVAGSGGAEQEAFLRDTRTNETVWMSEAAMRFSRFALSHEAHGHKMSMAACIYDVPATGAHIFFELPFVQLALRGSCVERRWHFDNMPTWLGMLEKLGLPSSEIKQSRASHIATAKRRKVDLAAVDFVASGEEFMVTTVALVIVLGRASASHSRRKDQDGRRRAEWFFHLLLERILGHGPYLVSMQGDLLEQPSRGDAHHIVVVNTAISVSVATWLLGGASVLELQQSDLHRNTSLPSDSVSLAMVLLALARMPGVLSGKKHVQRNAFLGLLRSVATLVGLIRFDHELWSSSPQRCLPELTTQGRRRRVASALKVELTDLAQEAGVPVHRLVISQRLWGRPHNVARQRGTKRKRLRDDAEKWGWQVQFQYLASGRALWRKPATTCMSLDAARLGGEETLLILAHHSGVDKCVWLPPQVAHVGMAQQRQNMGSGVRPKRV